MKIESVEKIIEYYVTTEDGGSREWHNYRTDGKGNWEVLMGESWETDYLSDEIEKEFQLWQKSIQINS